MGIQDDFADGFVLNDFGKVTGTVAGNYLSDLERTLVRFKTDAGNNGVFLLGENNENCFYPLYAGEDTGWFPARNLNEIYVKCSSGSSNYLYYWSKG